MALETVDVFTEDLDMTDFASRLVHSFVRTIDSTPDLILTTMDTMCSMMLQLGQKFLLFVPMVSKAVARHKISHQKFEVILAKITKVGFPMYNFSHLQIAFKSSIIFSLFFIFLTISFVI